METTPVRIKQGRSQEFSRGVGGGGGHTGSNNIVMAFSPRNIVGCLLKKDLQGGVTGTPGAPPSYALVKSFEFLGPVNFPTTYI